MSMKEGAILREQNSMGWEKPPIGFVADGGVDVKSGNAMVGGLVRVIAKVLWSQYLE